MNRLILFIAASIVFASCDYIGGRRISGNGNVSTESRPLTGFTGIRVGGAVDVVVTQDSAFGVKVETDENLQQYYETYVEDGMLRIREVRNMNPRPSRKTIVHVSAPELRNFGVSGACSVKSTNRLRSGETILVDISGASDADLDLDAPAVAVELTGASSADLKGQTQTLTIKGSGSSDVNAYDLLSENTEVRLSGAGSAEVHASLKLEAKTSGAAHIRYRGSPSLNSSISGAGSVKQVSANE